eukprot:477206_1
MSQFEQHSSPHSTTQEYSDDTVDVIGSDASFDDGSILNINNMNINKFSKLSYSDKIFNNVPPSVEHFIGNSHELILDSIYNDITKDNMNPFIVLLGTEGIGKTTITTTLCSDLLEENNSSFKNGILHINLLSWYKLYKYKTFEDCLIHSIKECNLNTYWTEKYDDFLEITSSNIFNKIDEYLSNSLIIFEDFDRFTEINDISLQDSNNFLFNLFSNISLSTRIIITSR